MKVLVVDIGGSSVKILCTGHKIRRKFPSGPMMTPDQMVAAVHKASHGWDYDVLSIGYPGRVVAGRPVAEPRNLGSGWINFDFESAFGRPVKIINDATMQAIGSYRNGTMLFLGLGTGLGSTLIAEGIVLPMELGHLPYKAGTFEEYVGKRGLRRFGKRQWRRNVRDVVSRLMAALHPEYVVIGGGNVDELKRLPPGCHAGTNANAFIGGFRLWESAEDIERKGPTPSPVISLSKTKRQARWIA